MSNLMTSAAIQQVQVIRQAIIVWAHLHHQLCTHCKHHTAQPPTMTTCNCR